uniref:Si:dkey-203a12.9 n=2 Tax=Cyprinus carpio TaxID=7962 RepID=A0A9J8CCB8_CYPCA
ASFFFCSMVICILTAHYHLIDGCPNCKYYSNICPLNYSPMCGTNEITYGNECMLYSAIKFKYAYI